MSRETVVISFAGGYTSLRLSFQQDFGAYLVERKEEGDKDWNEVARFKFLSEAWDYIHRKVGWEI